MKKILSTAILICIVIVSANGQNKEGETTLDNYYTLKNALVKGDAPGAMSGAGELVQSVKAIDMNSAGSASMNRLMDVQSKIAASAAKIAGEKKIDKQRAEFAALSEQMYALSGLVKLSSQPIYKDYCPMKKASWLSSEKTIQNPYFGSAMPTCGKVVETIQ